jgi:hypothetical protein
MPDYFQIGIIPTNVGKASWNYFEECQHSVNPRTCGENHIYLTKQQNVVG